MNVNKIYTKSFIPFSPELFPTDFSMVLSGKPPPNNPPIPGNLAGGGAPPLLEEFPPFLWGKKQNIESGQYSIRY